MHLWDYDKVTLQQGDDAERWQLERMILYGLGGEKLRVPLVRKHLPTLRIPEEHRYFLSLLL